LLAVNQNKDAIIKQKNFVPKDLHDKIPSVMIWNLGKDYIYKHHLLMLDIISTNAKNGWKRPIYFTSNISGNNSLNLKEFMQLEGLAYRLLPVRVPGAKDGFVNAELMYKNMMPTKLGGISDGKDKGFFYQGLNDAKAYHDENARRFPTTTRSSFRRLIQQLIKEGKMDKAKKAAKFCLEAITDDAIPYSMFFTPFIQELFKVGLEKEALEMAKTIGNRVEQKLNYIYANDLRKTNPNSLRYAMYNLYSLVNSLKGQKNAEAQTLYKKYDQVQQNNMGRFNNVFE
jgi:hypothetical protein